MALLEQNRNRMRQKPETGSEGIRRGHGRAVDIANLLTELMSSAETDKEDLGQNPTQIQRHINLENNHSLGAVHKRSHSILDNFRHPPPHRHVFLLLRPLYYRHESLDPLPL